MFKNKLGTKIIGATLSMVMAAAAIPAMTSLASENNFVPNYSPYKHAYSPNPVEDVTLDELVPYFTQVTNYYNQNKTKLPTGLYKSSEDVINYALSVISSPDSRPVDYMLVYNDLASLNRTVSFFADSDLPVIEGDLLAAADDVNDLIRNSDGEITDLEEEQETPDKEEVYGRLYSILDQMCDFGIDYASELNAVIDFNEYCSWVHFGTEVYYNCEDYSSEDLISLTDTLTVIYNDAVTALNRAMCPDPGVPAGPVLPITDPEPEDEFVAPDYSMNLDEEIAPDYGMDLDETEDETPAPETTDETPAPETADETPAPAAPAAQVLGAARDRRAIAEYIVEKLYNNVLNRASDAEGKTYWVNTLLADDNNLDMVVAEFVTSAELNARRLSDDEFIALLYRVMLNRAPSDSEKILWMSALANGATKKRSS